MTRAQVSTHLYLLGIVYTTNFEQHAVVLCTLEVDDAPLEDRYLVNFCESGPDLFCQAGHCVALMRIVLCG